MGQAKVLLYNGTTLVQNSVIALPADAYAFIQKPLPFTALATDNKVVV